MAQQDVAHNLTVSTIRVPGNPAGFGAVAAAYGTTKLAAVQKVITGTQTTITLQFNNWTMTTGTVKSVVRYT
jgi:hypothetical protein